MSLMKENTNIFHIPLQKLKSKNRLPKHTYRLLIMHRIFAITKYISNIVSIAHDRCDLNKFLFNFFYWNFFTNEKIVFYFFFSLHLLSLASTRTKHHSPRNELLLSSRIHSFRQLNVIFTPVTRSFWISSPRTVSLKRNLNCERIKLIRYFCTLIKWIQTHEIWNNMEHCKSTMSQCMTIQFQPGLSANKFKILIV